MDQVQGFKGDNIHWFGVATYTKWCWFFVVDTKQTVMCLGLSVGKVLAVQAFRTEFRLLAPRKKARHYHTHYNLNTKETKTGGLWRLPDQLV